MKNIIALSLPLLFIVSCSPKMAQIPIPNFDELLNDYHQEGLQLNPSTALVNGDNRFNNQLEITISEEYISQSKVYYQKYLTALGQYNRSTLNSSQKISYDILKWDCQINLEWQSFHPELMPMSQIDGLPLAITQLANGKGNQPFKTVQDYDNWLQRLEIYSTWPDLAIAKMKEGTQLGYVWPKEIVAKMIGQHGSMAIGEPEKHLYYGPIMNLPIDFSKEETTRLSHAYSTIIKEKIIPSFVKMYHYLNDEYLPIARTTYGISEIPNGKAYYNFLIKYWTTTDLNADQIHKIGLSEVARIRKEMVAIKEELEYDGDLPSFFAYLISKKELMPFQSAKEVLANFKSIQSRLMPEVNKMFELSPKTALEIRQIEAFREATASVHYQPGLINGNRSGVFYVPVPDATTYNTATDESLFLHEAIPGHHYQVALTQENTNLPDFRKLKWYGAYGEGWGLYSESLGKELGMYSDLYQYFGKLTMEMHRAIRLVVDTGIHAKGWTRAEAIKYSLENEAISEAGAAAEIERYIVIPGQALSYKIGELKIIELRNKAQKRLGDKFDIKKFHTKVLESGNLPLSVLEGIIEDWIGG